LGKPVVLIDIDGVLIDNIVFENKVTEFLISRLAENRQVEAKTAREYWERELNQTRDDPKWYDYDFHCNNLGLPSIAKDAHLHALPYVKVVHGAFNTWNYLTSRGACKIVVTDTREWIAKLKLKKASLDNYEQIYSSAERVSTKDMEAYWFAIKHELPTRSETILVDNRISNIKVARRIIKPLKPIYFKFDEHVSTLHVSFKPKYREYQTMDFYVPTVKTHDQLTELLKSFLGEM
jgi:FMN phosphatase YigB (HAD superfamily)